MASLLRFVLLVVVLGVLGFYLLQRRATSADQPGYSVSSVETTLKHDSTSKIQRIVFAYGDSLTFGSCPYEEGHPFPYDQYLQRLLTPNYASVSHFGAPGWTATQLLEVSRIKNDHNGMLYNTQAAINTIAQKKQKEVNDASIRYQIVTIILAGTNDLGRRTGSSDIIYRRIMALHDWAMTMPLETNGASVTRHTIAIAIPPSGFCSRNVEANTKRRKINEQLHNSSSSHQWLTYFPFPFDFHPKDPKWCMDTLHFSSHGYQLLGEALAPVVKQVFDSMKDER